MNPQISKSSRFPTTLFVLVGRWKLSRLTLATSDLSQMSSSPATFLLSRWVLCIHFNQKDHPENNGESLRGREPVIGDTP